MSTTFESDLRRRAESSVPAGMSLDVSTVLAAGRRRRAGRVAGAVGVAGVLALGGIVVAGLDLTSPAPSAARPHTIGDATAVEVAPGVLATNTLVERYTPDGALWWDTGLEPYPSAGYRYGFAPATDDELRAEGGSPAVLAGVSFGLYNPTTGKAPEFVEDVVSWRRVPTAADPVTPLSGWGGHGDEEGTVWDLTGHVSARVPSARAILIVPSGLANGRSFVELPTVVSPVDPDALLYAATIAEADLPVSGTVDFRPVVVFVGSDGSVDLNGECGEMSVESCSQMLGGGLVPALLSVGGRLTS